MSRMPEPSSASLLPLVGIVREMYGDEGFIPLHAPVFAGNEKAYLADCIDTTLVSSIGPYVDRFEAAMRAITGASYAVATMNGTAALHLALLLANAGPEDEVITQALGFVATSNAIAYLGAHPVFIDVDHDTLSLSPKALATWLERRAERRADGAYNRETGRRIAGAVPMHCFGLPGRIDELAAICADWGIPLVEDAAESLGSTTGNVHSGRRGLVGAFSFNGNKVVTSGGGGCIVTDDPDLGRRAKHLSTTAKVPHRWDFYHDEIGYNYRMPNINAALACAQLEQLDRFIANKRETAARYREFCRESDLSFVDETPALGRSNFWLNAVLAPNLFERDAFLAASNDAGVMTRPAWIPMHRLPAFETCERGDLAVTEWLADRIVNLPSSYRA